VKRQSDPSVLSPSFDGDVSQLAAAQRVQIKELSREAFIQRLQEAGWSKKESEKEWEAIQSGDRD